MLCALRGLQMTYNSFPGKTSRKLGKGTEIIYEFRTDGPRLIAKTGVKGGLAATGLIRIVGHGDAGLFQHLHHIEGGLRIELIHETRYE